jgi:hypothetical protein
VVCMLWTCLRPISWEECGPKSSRWTRYTTGKGAMPGSLEADDAHIMMGWLELQIV